MVTGAPTSPPSRPTGRLRASEQISAVFAARRSRAGRLLVVHARRRTDGEVADPATRVAVVASRRVGNAVRRNRAKRLVREAVRTLSLVGGHDLVVTARAACADAHVDEVVADLREAADRLDLVTEGARCS